MSENETEIVLGNKQLAGIFMVVAVLLGVAFTAGYMVRDRTEKKPAVSAAAAAGASTQTAEMTATAAKDMPVLGTGGQTHMVGSDDNGTLRPERTAATSSDGERTSPQGTRHKRESAKEAQAKPDNGASEEAGDFHPPTGRYLQVAAVSKDEAETLADVLHRKGFRAHAVTKPGSTKIFRVIVGPVRDAGDLSTTRDSLRKTGFREVIVQNY